MDTPITELGFAGVGVGAAMVGLRPIIEFMTWNFALLAIDQIVNSAAKMRYMSGGQIGVPIVFRGPAGAALQLAAQHSQCFEAMYAHIPGLKVVMPATPADAKGLLKSAIRDDDPIVFMEGEMLYNVKGEVPEGEHLVPIGVADVKRPGDQVSILCYSKTVALSLKAADQLAAEGISAEVVDLRTIRPLDLEAIFASVRRPIGWSWRRRAGPSPAPAPRSWTRSSATSSTSWMPRCCGSPGPMSRCPTTNTWRRPPRCRPRRSWRRRRGSCTWSRVWRWTKVSATS